MAVPARAENNSELSVRWVIAAHFYGVALTGLVYSPLSYALKLLFDSLTRDLPMKIARPLDLLALALFGLGLGLFLAFNQFRILRHWLHRRAAWLFASSLAMMLLVPGIMFLMQRLEFQPPPELNFYSLPVDQAKQLELSSLAWGWLGGAACGLAGGLLFGLLQSFFLPAHRRLWWLVNALAWALLVGIILAITNMNNLAFAWGPWGD